MYLYIAAKGASGTSKYPVDNSKDRNRTIENILCIKDAWLMCINRHHNITLVYVIHQGLFSVY